MSEEASKDIAEMVVEWRELVREAETLFAAAKYNRRNEMLSQANTALQKAKVIEGRERTPDSEQGCVASFAGIYSYF